MELKEHARPLQGGLILGRRFPRALPWAGLRRAVGGQKMSSFQPCPTTQNALQAANPRLVVEDKEKKSKEKPDFLIGKQKFKAELIPANLVISRCFASDQTSIEKLESEATSVGQQLEEMAEEHGGEDGLLESALNEKDKLTKASVSTRLRKIKDDPEAAEERKVLAEYLALVDKEAEINARIKQAQDSLLDKVVAKYGKLTEEEIKTLVVEGKWMTSLAAAVQGELDRVSQSLTGRIRQLAERYATPLPQIYDQVEALTTRVDKHLEKMGFSGRRG